mmetsp:Transcript_105859/g.252513  ORF Transcript_105859/g.252513 Transcript_105859/m.252513 type:complete len:291 (+) Transcript_105859:199-1071(+)
MLGDLAAGLHGPSLHRRKGLLVPLLGAHRAACHPELGLTVRFGALAGVAGGSVSVEAAAAILLLLHAALQLALGLGALRGWKLRRAGAAWAGEAAAKVLAAGILTIRLAPAFARALRQAPLEKADLALTVVGAQRAAETAPQARALHLLAAFVDASIARGVAIAGVVTGLGFAIWCAGDGRAACASSTAAFAFAFAVNALLLVVVLRGASVISTSAKKLHRFSSQVRFAGLHPPSAGNRHGRQRGNAEQGTHGHAGHTGPGPLRNRRGRRVQRLQLTLHGCHVALPGCWR